MRTSACALLLLSTSIAAAAADHDHYKLEAETDYWIELSGSSKADPVLVITPDR